MCDEFEEELEDGPLTEHDKLIKAEWVLEEVRLVSVLAYSILRDIIDSPSSYNRLQKSDADQLDALSVIIGDMKDKVERVQGVL